MYEYRQVLVRMRMGGSNRAIAEAGLMGRKKAQKLRDLAQSHGWLEPLNSLPDNTQLATVTPLGCKLTPFIWLDKWVHFLAIVRCVRRSSSIKLIVQANHPMSTLCWFNTSPC